GTGVGVRLLNGNNQYTGVSDIRQGYLELADNGRLRHTSAIVLHEAAGSWDATLTLDNEGDGGSAVDRIDAAVPVEFRGGRLSAFGGGAEAFGTLKFTEGHSSFDARTMILSADRIERQPGATLSAELMTPMGVAEAPSNVGGLLPWMIVQTGSTHTNAPYFLRFGEFVNGQIRPLDRASITTNLNAATANSNVGVPAAGPATLTADRTVKSLTIEFGGRLDLSGHTLTVESGAVAAGTSIRNGNITAGAASGGELILHDGSTFDANIIDGPGGLLSVTLASGMTLGGSNTFTGRLFANHGEVYLQNENALPDGVDIDVVGASLRISYNATETKHLGSVRIAGGGELTQQFSGDRGIGAFSFDEMLLEYGNVVVERLVGDSPIRKTTIGSVNIDAGMRLDAAYTGQIDVDDGLLTVRGLPGAKYVVNGGRLHLLEAANPVRLNGGELEVWRHSGPIEVAAASTIVQSPTFHEKTSVLSGPLRGSGALSFKTDPRVFDGDFSERALLAINHDNPGFHGDVHIYNAAVAVRHNQGLGTGDVTVHAGGSLQLSPNFSPSEIDFANRVILDGGQLIGAEGRARFTGELRVLSPSHIGMLNATGPIYLSDGAPLTTLSDEPTRLLGQLHVGADAQLRLGRHQSYDRGLVEVGGTVVADESSSQLNIMRGGLDELEFTASLHVAAGRSLEIQLDGQPMPLDLGAGQTISGGGAVTNPVDLGPGAMISPGSSTGVLTLRDVTFSGGAAYEWEFNNLGGEPGGAVGWDLLSVDGTLAFDATPVDPWQFTILPLPPAGTPARLGNDASWLIAEADSIVGFDAAAVEVVPPTPGTGPGGHWWITQSDQRLILNYHVPEPAGICLAAVASLAVIVLGRSRLRPAN
ncbi:MAG TPA: hypothetical protein VF175_16195, partial [Lacipirellula sp.]